MRNRSQNAHPLLDNLDDKILCTVLEKALGLRYNITAGRFSIRSPGDPQEKQLNDHELLALLAKSFAAHPYLLPELTFKRLKKIVSQLKHLVADAGDDVLIELEHFVASRLELLYGADVTVAELHVGYAEFCRNQNKAPVPRRHFEKRISASVLNRYNVLKSHGVKRPKPDGSVSYHYGFHNLAIRTAHEHIRGEAEELREAGEQSILHTATTQ